MTLGISNLLGDRPPDLVVSGINRGGNMGVDVHYSGTVSAAFEGVILGYPAIAVSQVGGGGDELGRLGGVGPRTRRLGSRTRSAASRHCSTPTSRWARRAASS